MSISYGYFFKRLSITKDVSAVDDACLYFETQAEEARGFLDIQGRRYTEILSKINAEWEYRYGQSQEMQFMIDYMENELGQLKSKKAVEYTKLFGKLTDKMLMMHVDHDNDVLTLRERIQQLAFVQSRMDGICTALNSLQFKLQDLAALVSKGMEEVTVRVE